MKKILKLLLFFVYFLILLLVMPGVKGNPDRSNINADVWREGPFELSPQRGRFALTYSIIEEQRLDLSPEMARFSLPDIGFENGKYVILFAPGASFYYIPGYLFGRYLGSSQLGMFVQIILTSLANAYLVMLLAKKLGASKVLSDLTAFIFLFASPVFFYSVNLYQHQVTLLLLLASIYLAFDPEKIRNVIMIFLFYGLSVVVDYPNIFLFLPLIIYIVSNQITTKLEMNKININFKLSKTIALIGIVPGILILFWFNSRLFSNPFQLTGTAQDVVEITSEGERVFITNEPEELPIESPSGKNAINFFNTRNLIRGLYIHILSDERGIMYYTPVLVFSIIGFANLLKTKKRATALLIGIVSVNIVLYSLWGDPWGGWAFGSRYLIPTYAILSVALAFALEKIFTKNLFLLIFFVFFVYSLVINTIGVVAGFSIPPKSEAVVLESRFGDPQLYTSQRSYDDLIKGKSRSYIKNTYFPYKLSAFAYYNVVASFLIIIASIFTYSTRLFYVRRLKKL